MSWLKFLRAFFQQQLCNLSVELSNFHCIKIRGVMEKLSARYALVRFIELKSLSVGHLIYLKDIGSVKSMRACLVDYVKLFQERWERHNCKMEKLEIRTDIKYFCKKGMPSKVFHEDFMETLGRSLLLLAP